MMFADTITNFSAPENIAAWLACCAFAIWFLLLCDKGIQRMRGDAPQPPNGELKQSIKQLNDRLKILEEWRNDLTQKLEGDKNQILEAGEDRARRIYTHVEDVRKEIDGKITDLPDRIIATLKNTGAI